MKILFCALPSSSLFGRKIGLEISIGASQTVGLLCEHGHHVDFFDLNLALNFQIKEDYPPLSQDEFEVLTNPKKLSRFIKDPVPGLRLGEWATTCLQDITLDGYDLICFSLDRRLYRQFPSLVAFHFALFLYSEMKTSTPLFLGGELALEIIGPEVISESYREIPKEFLPYKVFRQHQISNIDKHLNLDERPENPIVHLGKERFANTKNAPVLKTINWKDGEILGEDLTLGWDGECSSEIKNLKPFVIAPLRFSSGCPFKCSFCPSGQRDYVGQGDPKFVVDQLEKYTQQGISNFRFFNNNINVSKKFVLEFSSEIVRRGLRIQFSDSANLKIADAEIFSALSEAGCIKLWFGTETISQDILKQIRKRTKLEQILKALRFSRNSEIWNSCNFIVNFPHESEAEAIELLEFVTNHVEEGIINTFQVNNFKVLKDTEYHLDPARFKINLLEPNKEDAAFTYEEIDGLPWKEKLDQGRFRRDRFNQIISEYEINVRSSDPLYFALRSLGWSIEKITQHIQNRCKQKQNPSNFKAREWYQSIHPWIPNVRIYQKYCQKGKSVSR